MADFVHLHLHSTYSLLDGANRIDAVCQRAKALGMPAVAVTDHGNLFGAIELLQAAKTHGLTPIVGMEAYVAPGSRHDRGDDAAAGAHHDYNHLVLLATNDQGYRNLIKLSSLAYLEGFYYKPRIDHDLLSQHHEGLIALSGCLRGEIPAAISDQNFAQAKRAAGFYKDLFGARYFFEIQANGLQEQLHVNRYLYTFSQHMGVPLVATNDCHYLHEQDAMSHDILLCLQTGATRSQPNRFTFSSTNLYFRTPEEMTHLYLELPDALRQTVVIAEQCTLQYHKPGLQLPNYPLAPGETLDSTLRRLATEGLTARLTMLTPADSLETYHARLHYELDVITRLKFSGYFLILWDIIHWAQTNGIPTGPGRGSAAGSLVAFALGLTELDPIRHHLIFERFLNPDRVSPPDIDTDFCMARRDEVITYIRQRFGQDRVAQIITFGTLGAKAVLRDVARVLEHPYQVGDRLAKLVPHAVGMTLDKAIADTPPLAHEIDSNPDVAEIIRHAKVLEGLTRHASTHAAGVVITPGPLTDYVPLAKTTTDDIVTQYSMEDLDAIGLVKFDVLGLRTLTVIDYAVRLVKQSHPDFSLPITQLDDPATYELICSGNTIGVFQLENTGMRALLKRLQPTVFDDITAVLALYRPGPLESGMVEDFVYRKQGRLPIQYEFPVLEPILKDTYGTIVYQEQVIALAQALCGMTASQADLLRRAMGKKKAEEMAKTKAMFVEGGVKKGYPEQQIADLYDKIALFAGYSFNRSHSAAYAILTYQTAYLKAHYPTEYMTAVLTSEQGHPDKLARYLTECRTMGLKLFAPDLNHSLACFTRTPDGILFGLSGVKHMGPAAVDALLAQRTDHGPFTSLLDLCTRIRKTAVTKRSLETLIKTGALDSLHPNRSTLLAELPEVLKAIEKADRPKKQKIEELQTGLFADTDLEQAPPAPPVVLAPPPQSVESLPLSERLIAEKDLLGVYLSGHPLDAYHSLMTASGALTTEHLDNCADGDLLTLMGLVGEMRTSKTKKGDLMAFVTFEDAYGTIDGVIFPKTFEEMGACLTPNAPVLIRGTLDRNDQRESLKVFALHPLQTGPPPANWGTRPPMRANARNPINRGPE